MRSYKEIAKETGHSVADVREAMKQRGKTRAAVYAHSG